MRSIKGMTIALIAAMSMAVAACGSGHNPDDGSGGGGPSEGYDTVANASADVEAMEAIKAVDMVHPMTGQPITDAGIADALGGQVVDLSSADVSEARRIELERATGLVMIAIGGCAQEGAGPDCPQLKTAQAQLERLTEDSAS